MTQITGKNVATLQQAWSFDTGSLDLQVAPLVIADMLYLTGGSTVFALEPETGNLIWKFEAGGPVSGMPNLILTVPELAVIAGTRASSIWLWQWTLLCRSIGVP